MSRKVTSTRDDNRRTANRARRGHYDRELRAEAQRAGDEAERVADGMRSGILAQVARFLSGRW